MALAEMIAKEKAIIPEEGWDLRTPAALRVASSDA